MRELMKIHYMGKKESHKYLPNFPLFFNSATHRSLSSLLTKRIVFKTGRRGAAWGRYSEKGTKKKRRPYKAIKKKNVKTRSFIKSSVMKEIGGTWKKEGKAGKNIRKDEVKRKSEFKKTGKG